MTLYFKYSKFFRKSKHCFVESVEKRTKKAQPPGKQLRPEKMPSDQREPLSYGMPSALGAMLFLEVKARMTIDATKGIML